MTRDPEWLSALVAVHARWLTAFLRGLTACEADAEDAFQETWLRVMKAKSPFRGVSEKAYLTRVARSVVIDRYRRNRRYDLTVDAAETSESPSVANLPDPAPTPDRRFESAATREDVLKAVRALRQGPREVFLMRVEGEMTFQQIADELGIPLGTALTWMRTASHSLKKTVEEIR